MLALVVIQVGSMNRCRFEWRFLLPQFWPLWFGFGLFWLVVQLPYKWLLALGRMLGRLMYRYAGKRRHIARRNLELCFPQMPPEQREQMVRDNFDSIGIAFFEMGMSWWWPRRRLARLVRVEGLEQLQQLQQQGQGVILMAIHFTTLEIGAALLGGMHTIDGMYRAHKNPVYNYVQRRGRERHNPDSIAIERDDIRAMLKQLRSGRAIWYAPDHDYGTDQDIFVPLFGIQASTITATTKFARLGKAKVVPMVQERLADGSGYVLRLEAPWQDFPGEDVEQDCLRINQWIEQAILQCPQQYLWVHRRFKTRPQGEEKLY